ncbi:MAG: glycosyltransferase family 4 protein, partial [Gemmatimonadota bacterium]
MRILHVLAPALAGGLERVVADLTIAQGERGNDVLVLAVGSARPEVAPFLDTLEPGRVTGRPLLVPSRAYRKERAAVAALCREWGPHVIHTHGYRPDVVDAGPGRRTGAAAVSTVHGFVGGGVRNRFYEWLQCRAYR